MAQSKIDLRERTKSFALRIVRMFSTLPKTTGSAGSWETGAALRYFDWCKLSGGVPRPKQSGIYCQVRWLPPRDRRHGLLARVARGGEYRFRRKARTSPSRNRWADIDLCDNYQALEGAL